MIKNQNEVSAGGVTRTAAGMSALRSSGEQAPAISVSPASPEPDPNSPAA